MKFNNGDRVKDEITGLSGIVTCVLSYFNGCTRYHVQPEKLHEGKPIADQYFDEPQLKLVKSGVYKGINDTGGFQPAPPPRSRDRR